MADAPFFTEEELRLGASRSVDALAEALDQGDFDAAAHFGKRLRREVLSMRQNYDGWEATLLDWTRREGGDDAAAKAGAAMDATPTPALSFLDEGPESSESEPDAGERWRAVARQLGQAVEQRDAPTAKRLGHQLQTEGLTYHDRGMARVNSILSFIGREYGIDRLEVAYEEAMASDMLGDASFRERAEALMHFTRVHLQSFRLEEDEEKLTFLCDVCPSGGRMIREGRYQGPNAALEIEGPRWLTYQRDSLPVYCAHEPIMERASILRTGEPLFIVDASDNLGQVPCKTYLYKDPSNIPERFYQRVGLQKPKNSNR